MNPVTYNISGKLINVHCNVDRFLHEVMDKKEYDFLDKNLVVLDLGCNIGTWTISIYDRIKQGYGIDVSQQNIDLFNETITENGLVNLKTYCMAIAGETGKRNVHTDEEPGNGGWHLTASSQPAIEVDAIDIKTFMEREQIPFVDVMKIDIEGGEHEVFSSQAFQDVAPRIHTIIGEYHHHEDKEDIERAGYRYQTLGGHFIAKRNK